MSTRQLHDAIGRRYRERAGRELNTTSTLLAALVEDGWIAGEKHGGRWRWKPAVSRSESLQQLALMAVADFSERERDSWFLVHAALGSVLARRPERRTVSA